MCLLVSCLPDVCRLNVRVGPAEMSATRTATGSRTFVWEAHDREEPKLGADV